MSGWQFGGWPPPPPAPGFAKNAAPNFLDWESTSATIAASAFITIPAPAPGFIRVVAGIYLTSLGATPNYNITLEPSGLFLAERASAGTSGTGGVVARPSFAGFCFGADETVKVANGGTASVGCMYSYIDITSANRTVFRVPFANVAADIVPVAPAGYFNRLVMVQRNNQSGTVSWASPSYMFNDDTAQAIVETVIGGVVVSRSTLAIGNSTTPLAVTMAKIKLSAMTLRTQAAVATRQLMAYGCYETVREGAP